MNIFIRRKINKCISILESGNEPDIEMLYSKFPDAMRVLEANGSIELLRAWGGEVVSVRVTNLGFSIYKLSRHDIWVNRFWGFILGIATGVAIDLIVRAIF